MTPPPRITTIPTGSCCPLFSTHSSITRFIKGPSPGNICYHLISTPLPFIFNTQSTGFRERRGGKERDLDVMWNLKSGIHYVPRPGMAPASFVCRGRCPNPAALARQPPFLIPTITSCPSIFLPQRVSFAHGCLLSELRETRGFSHASTTVPKSC